MKKINNILLLSFLVLSVFLFVNLLKQENFPTSGQVAATYPAIPSSAPVTPVKFWEFSGSTTIAQKTPTIGSDQFAGTTAPVWSVGTGGPVGNFLDKTLLLPPPNGNAYFPVSTISTGTNGAFSIEFMWKPGRYFRSDTLISSNGFSLGFRSHAPEDSPQAFHSASGETPGPFWELVSGSQSYKIIMNGENRKSLAYYTDGAWHHMVVVYDPAQTSDKLQLWVDGENPVGFSFNTSVSTSGQMYIGGYSSSYTARCSCLFDQFAIYNKAIPGNLIKEHYGNMLTGTTYQYWTNITNVPGPNNYAGALDPFDFTPGLNIDSSQKPTPGVTTPVLTQYKNYPLPRYKTGNTLIRNVSNWLSSDKLANALNTSISGVATGQNATNVAKMKDINVELAKKWGYTLSVGDLSAPSGGCSTTYYNSLATNQSSWIGGYLSIANDSQYYSIPTSLTTYRIQSQGNRIYKQDNPSQYYLQNSSGSFILRSNGIKQIRPLLANLSYYDNDGAEVKSCVQAYINAMSARKTALGSNTLAMINDNAEDLPYAPPYQISDLQNDPAVSSAVSATFGNTSTLSYQKYSARFAGQLRQRFADTIKTSDGAQNAIFQHYLTDGIDGTLPFSTGFGYEWSEYKITNSSVNNQRYATSDFYVSHPYNWAYWIGPKHGFHYLVSTRNREIADGDNLFSPYVSAGCDSDERQNVRPGQILGFYKLLGVAGAEYFYPGLFWDLSFCGGGAYMSPENVAWQAIPPAYAQATTSYFEDFLKNGKIMWGDSNRLIYGDTSICDNNCTGLGTISPYVPPLDDPENGPGFRFYSSDPSKVVIARKMNGANKFVITGTIQPYSSVKDNVPSEAVADIMFGGKTFPTTTSTTYENLKFKVRKQGSTYIYDKTGASPVFYQIDSWHEGTHPWYWSKDFSFESEVYDTGSASRTTIVPSGTPSGDYTNFNTYINPASGSTTYNFEPRDAASNSNKTFYLWALVKSASGNSGGQFKIDNGTAQTISTSSNSFTWCKASSAFSNVVSNSSHTLTFTGTSANFHLDKILLTTDANLNLGNCGGATDTTAPTVSITAPSNGASITSGPVAISANASDVSGIASVEFKVDGVSIGIDTTSPYSVSWDLTGVSNGSHQIIATATDNASNTANATISVTVNIPDTIPPTTPSNLSATRSSNNVVLSWGASTDSGGSGLAGYHVYRNSSSTPLNTTPTTSTSYTDTSATPNATITYTVRAKDNAGNLSTNSNQVSIYIDTQGPTVSITNPSSGATVSGTVTISANLTDATGINHFDAYLGTTVICTATGTGQTAANMSCQWNSAGVANGTYQFSIKAYDTVTNPASNSTTTTSFPITVNNVVVPPPDTTPPTVSISSPSAGTTVSGSITVSANATDNVGINKVEFYLDNASTPFATVTSGSGSSFSTSFDTTVVSNGNHLFKAKAFDTSGNTTTSGTVTVNVNNTVAGSPDLTILSISPLSGSVGQNMTFSAEVKNQGTGPVPASPSAPLGISWYINGVSVGCSDVRTTPVSAGETITITMGTGTAFCTTSPLTPFWNAVSGTHSILANVDDLNRFTESNETNNTITSTLVIAQDTTAPTTSISSPSSGSIFTAGNNVVVTANATDSSGIANVKIYVNGSQIGQTLTTAPYTTTWNTTGLSSGTYTITSVATDNAGNSTTSSPISVTIQAILGDTTPPVISFSCPNGNCNVSNNTPVMFNATVTDNVGVSEVKFFLGSTSTTPKCTLSTPTTSPNTYSCSIQIGTAYSWWKKTITVQAKDTFGNITTKSIQVY